MITSAGTFLIVDNRILLCHPTNSPWAGTYSIPKGLIDSGETESQAAIRECFEETGIDIKGLINEKSAFKVVSYFKGKSTQPFKQVKYFTVNTTLDKLGLSDYIIPREKLQIEEVDWAGFLTKEEAKEKIFYRFRRLLDELK